MTYGIINKQSAHLQAWPQDETNDFLISIWGYFLINELVLVCLSAILTVGILLLSFNNTNFVIGREAKLL